MSSGMILITALFAFAAGFWFGRAYGIESEKEKQKK